VVIKVFSDKGFTEAAKKVNDFSERHFCDDPQDAKKRDDGKGK